MCPISSFATANACSFSNDTFPIPDFSNLLYTKSLFGFLAFILYTCLNNRMLLALISLKCRSTLVTCKNHKVFHCEYEHNILIFPKQSFRSQHGSEQFFLKEYTDINVTVANRPLGSLYCLCFFSVEGVLNVFIVSVTTKNIRNFWKPCFEHFKAFVICRHDTRSRKEQQHSATSVWLSQLVIRNRKLSCFAIPANNFGERITHWL